ncbi:MAG: hypothetical protein ACRC4T_15560 [Cetobacterium sp.]
MANIKEELRQGLREIREELKDSIEVIVEYADGKVIAVNAITYNIDITYKYMVIEENKLFFNILLQDLKDIKAPIKGFKHITYNRIKYIVEQRIISSFGEVIVLEGKRLG